MRKISATYIFPGNKPPLKNGILICDDDGKILKLTDTGGQLTEQAGLEYYSGILMPGFINANHHAEPPPSIVGRGTNRLAQKQQLSTLSEMIALQQNSPELSLEELIKRATINAARALQIDDCFGSFEPGKRPGINLITGADLKNLKLTAQSKLKKLV